MPESAHDMDRTLAAMRRHLEREDAAYARMLDLGRQQQAALIARDTDALARLVTAQAPLAAEAASLHRSGQETLARLGAAWRLPSEITLSRALDLLPAERGTPLRNLRDSIARRADEIAWLQQTNRLLLETAMEAVQFTVRLLADAASGPEAGYAPSDAPQRSASLMLDQTA